MIIQFTPLITLIRSMRDHIPAKMLLSLLGLRLHEKVDTAMFRQATTVTFSQNDRHMPCTETLSKSGFSAVNRVLSRDTIEFVPRAALGAPSDCNQAENRRLSAER